MPLASVGTWGGFEPGYVCRAVSWALELVELVGWAGRRQGSSKWEAAGASFHLAAITRGRPGTGPARGTGRRPCPWGPHAVCVSCSSNAESFTKSPVRGLQWSSTAQCVLSYTTSWWGPCWHTGLLEFSAITAQTLFHPPRVLQAQKGTHIPFKWRLRIPGESHFWAGPTCYPLACCWVLQTLMSHTSRGELGSKRPFGYQSGFGNPCALL